MPTLSRLASEIADIVSGGGAVPATASGVAAGAVSETAVPIDRLQARAEEGRVRIFWEVLPGAPPVREIQVFRSPSEEGPFQLLGPAAENRFVDEQVMPGRTYYYRLVVVQEDGAQVRVPRTVKVRYAGERQAAAPLILGGSAGVRWAEIRFVPSLRNEKDGFSIVRYQVYRKDGQGDGKRIQTVKATPRSQFNPDYTVLDRDGLEDGSRYTYTVAGKDEQGVESRRSDPQTVATAPRPVLTVAQQGLLRRVHFSWEPVTGVDGYRLYRKSGDEAWKKVKTVRGAEKSSATDESGLKDGLTYDYQLTAYDDRGETGPSPAVVAETKPTPPAPEGLAAESGGVKSVQVRWEPVEDPDVKGYAVYRSEGDSGSFERIARVTKETAYRDKGSGFTPLKDGVAYTYQVAAYNRYDAEGERAGPVTARTKPRPTPVAALTAALKEDRVVVQWEPGPEDDIQTQVLSRSQNQGFWSELEKMPAGRTTFEDADVKSGASYRYRIVVTDADDLQSDAAESEPVTVP